MAGDDPEGNSNPPAPSQADETAVWTPPPPPAPPPQATPYPPPPPAPPPPAPPAPFEPPPYSPPPAYAPTQVPPAYQQQFGAPYAPYTAPPPQAAPRRGRGRMLLIIGIIVVVVLAALGGGGVLANASLSSTYSPQKAVSDYFAAMGKGDVNGMMNNATFLTGDSTYSQFFDKAGLTAMMSSAGENKEITEVKVGTISTIDDSTRSVKVTLSWGGTPRDVNYKVQKDTSRNHFLFYPSWRVQVPFSTITINLPSQPGAVQIDGMDLPAGSSKKAEVIQGFHKVVMRATDFYSEATITADGVDASPIAQFPTNLSGSAQSAAADAVKGAFNNVTCDANKYFDCPNHQYKVAAGYYDVLPAAGGDIRANSGWSLAFEGDPTTGMKLTVSSTSGQVDASGTCAMKMTVDGSHVYHFTGTWSGKLTWANGAFNSDLTISCDDARA